MHQTNSPLKDTFIFLNSMLFPVMLAYVLEPGIVQIYFSQTVLDSFVGLWLQGMLIFLKVCFYSGIYGAMVDVACERNVALTMKRYFENVKEFWKIYVLLAFIPLVFHFLLFVFFPDLDISLFAFTIFTDVIILYILAEYIIHKKFVKPYSLPKKNVVLNFNLIGIFIGINVINILLLKLTTATENVYIYRALILLFKYLHFFVFLFYIFIVVNCYPKIKETSVHNKEVFFINPLIGGVLNAIVSMIFRRYPLIFGVLKALTPDGYHIKEFNMMFWHDRYYAADKLVVITCFTSNSLEAYKIAKEFKKRGSKVIMGGPHVTFLCDEALEYCDSVVVGDAEGIWEDVIKDYEDGKLKRIYHGPLLDDFYEKVHEKLMTFPPEEIVCCIQTGRGCKFNCDFCVIPAICGRKIRNIPIKQVVALIKRAKKKQKTFYFLDNNIYADPKYARELFESLKPLRIEWFDSSSIDIAKDETTLRLAKESGCRGLLIGYETSDSVQETSRRGKFTLTKDYRKLTKRIKKTGIKINALFIFGFENDSWRSLIDMWIFCFTIFPNTTGLGCLVPFPGSRHFLDMVNDNRITNLNWRSYANNNFVFKTKRINAAVFNTLYPIIRVVFFLTTSKVGVIILTIWMFLMIYC